MKIETNPISAAKESSSPLSAPLISVSLSLIFLISVSLTGLAGLSVTPLLLDLTIDPGGSGGGTLTVQNTGQEPLEIEAQVRGFKTTERGVAKFLSPSAAAEYPYSGENFLTLDPQKATLAGGETKEFTYEVSYPKETDPFGGRYVGALFKATPVKKEKKEEGGGSSIEVATRVGTLILLRPSEEILVGKEFREFKIKPVIEKLSAKVVYGGDRLLISTLLKNSGNIHIREKEFEGQIKIISPSGDTIEELTISPHNVLPATSYVLNELWRLPEEMKEEPEETHIVAVNLRVKTPYGEVIEIRESKEIDL